MNYQAILTHAVALANADPRKPPFLGGDIFYPPVNFDELSVMYDSDTVRGAIAVAQADPDDTYNTMVAIVQDAVQKALVEFDNGREFVSIMLGQLNADSS